jgi:hypothetical protein
MPIKIDNKTFGSFKQAVTYIIRKKKWTKERASAYVATIERKQRGE